jgi:hypothetical protein
MKAAASGRSAISTNLLTAVIVISFVAVVTVALVLSFLPSSSSGCGTTVPSNFVCLTGLVLYSGDKSVASTNQSCEGFAQLEISGYNQSPNSVQVTNITVYQSSASMTGSALIGGSNSCLDFVYNSQPLTAQSDFDLEVYLNVTIGTGSNWNAFVSFDNGQNLTQLLAAV